MKGILIDIEGNWGHFKKPETNNNPLTHDFITKTALIGMIGAVLGIERVKMAELFPQFSEDLLYGVCVQSAVRKESWGFTMRRAVDVLHKAPKQMEFLKRPHYTVALALRTESSREWFEKFATSIERNESCYTPVLGLHNCPANLALTAAGSFEAKSGSFLTAAFVTTKNHKIENVWQITDFRVGLDRIPTFQSNKFFNLLDRYVAVVYPSEGRKIQASGEHYEFTNGSKWVLI